MSRRRRADAKADRITGSCFQWATDGSSLKFDWDLTRVGPAPGS